MSYLRRYRWAAALLAVTLLCACTPSNTGEEVPGSITDTDFASTSEPASVPQNVETTVVPWEDKIPDICSSRYGYYTLDASEKAIYDKVYEAARRFSTTVEIDRSISKTRLEEICRILYLEETSLYYLSKEYSISYNAETGEATEVELAYAFDRDTVEYMNTMTEEAVSEILAEITDDMSDVDKIKLFHDEIVLRCQYSVDADYAATPYGALVDGNALCEGYARALAVLCNKAGIENLFATGIQYVTDAEGQTVSEEHIWNMVKVNGLWYNIDATWDDPTSSKASMPLREDYISYGYFLIPSSELRPTMTVDHSLFALPDATSLESNYFVYYGYYASTYEEAEEILKKSVNECNEAGGHYIRMRFATPQLYTEATNRWFKNREIFEICPDQLPQKIDFYWNENTKSFQIVI